MQVRDALGLTYDVSFELSLYDRLRTGWFVCHVTSTHAKIDAASALPFSSTACNLAHPAYGLFSL